MSEHSELIGYLGAFLGFCAIGLVACSLMPLDSIRPAEAQNRFDGRFVGVKEKRLAHVPAPIKRISEAFAY